MISGNGTTTTRDHAAGVSTAGHPPGRDAAAAPHPHGTTNRVISPTRKGKSRGRSRVMERTGGDHDAGDAQDTGAVFCTWNSSQLFYRILYDGSSFGGKLTFSF